MQTAVSLDPSDDAHSPAPYVASQNAAEFARLSPGSLSDLSYSELTKYRAACFDEFCKASNNAARDHWLHAMADAIVQQGVTT